MKKVHEEFDARYMDPLTDFGFHKIFGSEAKELLIDFLNQIIRDEGVIKDIEYLIPEQLGDLETHFEEWLYILKNLPKFKNRPALVQGKIFEKLFEIAEIKRLTEKEMETYNKSITEYHDVRLCMDCARDEGREEGREEGIKKGRELVIQKCLQKNMPIEDIIFITGFSKEQIKRYMKNGAQ